MSTLREQAWAVLMAAYPRWDVAPAQRRAWDVLLADVPDDLLFAGAVAFARKSEFPPTVAGWRTAAAELRSQREEVTAAEAWAALEANRRRFPYTGHLDRPASRGEPIWPNQAAARAAESVRWNDPNWEAEQIPTLRAQFERYYVSLSRKQDELAQVEGTHRVLGALGARVVDRLNGRE